MGQAERGTVGHVLQEHKSWGFSLVVAFPGVTPDRRSVAYKRFLADAAIEGSPEGSIRLILFLRPNEDLYPFGAS